MGEDSADTRVYRFAYTVSNGKSTQTDVTDPVGYVRRGTFNPDGYTLSDTRARWSAGGASNDVGSAEHTAFAGFDSIHFESTQNRKKFRSGSRFFEAVTGAPGHVARKRWSASTSRLFSSRHPW